MAYTTIDNPSEYFLTKLYAGNGSTQDIGGIGFQPDWVWLKNRTDAGNDPVSIDSVRGVTKEITTNTELAEVTNADGLTAFGSDGFSVGDDDMYNTNAENFVSWNWLAGTSFSNDASSTGVGSIDSVGSVNTDAGFSIISYTGNGTAGATVAHGLGAIPQVYILKNRSSSAGWTSYFEPLGATKFLQLNTTGAAGTTADAFNNTSPTSSVFSLGTDTSTNNTDNFIAYCFAEKKGYSKISSFVGNGSNNGSYIHLGFKAAFIMIKRTDSSGNWNIMDNKRIGYNPDNNEIRVHESSGEQTSDTLDILSNGFKMRSASGSFNESGGSYIYMAFASNPFTTSTGVPATAR